jgi:hypothetical protein
MRTKLARFSAEIVAPNTGNRLPLRFFDAIAKMLPQKLGHKTSP